MDKIEEIREREQAVILGINASCMDAVKEWLNKNHPKDGSEPGGAWCMIADLLRYCKHLESASNFKFDETIRLTARVEALKRAVCAAKSCRTCSVNTDKTNLDKLLVEPCASCNKVVKQNWVFDEQRFAGGELDG